MFQESKGRLRPPSMMRRTQWVQRPRCFRATAVATRDHRPRAAAEASSASLLAPTYRNRAKCKSELWVRPLEFAVQFVEGRQVRLR